MGLYFIAATPKTSVSDAPASKASTPEGESTAPAGESSIQDPIDSTGLRHRDNVAPSAAVEEQEEDDAGSCGKIRLTLSYNPSREELRVFVNRASGLPGAHLEDPPDPYVKLYLLPERSKKSKRKTDVVKDSVDPAYDEEFTYSDVGPARLLTMQLEVTVVDKKTRLFAKSPVMGRAVIELAELSERSDKDGWFPLEEHDDDSD